MILHKLLMLIRMYRLLECPLAHSHTVSLPQFRSHTVSVFAVSVLLLSSYFSVSFALTLFRCFKLLLMLVICYFSVKKD